MAECGNCGNKAAVRWRISYGKDGRREECDQCGRASSSCLPDVYFRRAHKDANIVDNMGNPILIESKGHKQKLLRERGWVEAGLGRENRMRV